MSFSKNGPGQVVKRSKPEYDRTVNSVGKTHFGKWYLYTTDFNKDAWKKDVVDDAQGIIVADSYIRIVRDNTTPENREYMVFFTGEARFLIEEFKKFLPEYEGPFTRLKFTDIQAAKDFVDRFLVRLNNLLVFI